MQIQIRHLSNTCSDFVGSYEMDIAPNIGDDAKITISGNAIEGKVASKCWDFTKDKPLLVIEISPL